MAAPTLSAYQQSTWTDNVTTAEATASVAWSAGDFVVLVGITEDNTKTFDLPTVSGLTFANILVSNTGSNCKVYVWTATAAGTSSGVISAGPTGGSAIRGLSVFVYSGSDGLGATATQAAGSATVKSLVRATDNSAVIYGIGDWSANADVTVTSTPATGATQRVAIATAGATFFVLSWTDQGAAATTNYGFTGGGASLQTIGFAVEIKGTAGGAASILPQMMAHHG